MSLSDQVYAGVETAFAAVSDFVSVGTYYVRSGTPTYNPTTDTLSVAENTWSSVRMLRTTFTAQEREASPVTINDVKMLVPSVDLPGVKISETDHFVLDGTAYNVQSFSVVPGGSLYTIIGRRK